MSVFQAFILGIIQGVTELFPVSSSGHLIILPRLFGWGPHPLFFDTTLHLGTALALIVVFWKDLVKVFKDLSYAKSILIGILPAGLLGFFLNGWFESVFRDVFWVVLFLIFGSLLMSLAELLFIGGGKLSFLKALVIGLFQTLALFPGVSRSGSTISGGMFVGLSREQAARFSFMLAIPLSLAAGLYEGVANFGSVSADYSVSLLVGFLTSFVFGFFSVKFLLKFLKSHKLWVFVGYRLLLALVLMVVVL